MFASSKSGAVAEPTDNKFNYVTMLLHGNGTNGAQNNTFVDSSTNNFTITRNGNTTQGTFSPYGSNWSNYFDGSGDYLTGTSPNLNGTWTVELWWFPTVLSGNQTIISFNNGSGPGINIWTNSSGQLSVDDANTGQSAFTTTTFTKNTWNHLAVVRNGTTTTGYINGVVAGSNSFTPSTTSAFSIGRFNGGTFQYSNGYISNVRVVNGTAVYTSAFTPPTTPLTAITNTCLLTCQSNRFIDNSTNAYTITRNGDVSVQRFSPFNATSAYSTSVIGGSGYFDGTGDYLALPANSCLVGANDFTLESWVYVPDRAAEYAIFNSQSNATTAAGSSYGYAINTNGTLYSYFYIGSSTYNITSTGTVPINAWSHVALVRTGGTVSLFINGVRDGTRSDISTSSINAGATNYPPCIGINTIYYIFKGYIANLRLLVGSGGYNATSSTITIPTTPLTAVTNTQVLSNFTNAGILDNAMMNDLETVGNAQISTSVVKYGTGSMYFDGTGDGLKNLNTPILYLTTGDWTVEGWFYTATPNASVATRTLFCTGSPVQIYSQSNTVAMYVASDNAGTYFVNPASGPANSVSTNTWTHFACVKSGNNYTVYVNGVAGTTVTSSTAPAIPTGITGIGYYAPSASGFFTGYIDDFRVTKGYARYTSNFTPPTAAFADKG